MGKHYVPQAHLRRFQIDDSPGFVWMYDKQTEKFSKAAVKKVAQEADFYPEEVEKALAEVVERPANMCIDKLLRKEKLDNGERTSLSLYMLIMATRGPRQRRKSLELAPKVLKGVVDETRQEIEKAAGNRSESEQSQRQLEELKAAEERFSKQLPENLVELIRTPFWSEQTVEGLHNMRWHILPAPGGTHFVTADTPAHFFECWGVGNAESEFTFPISRDFALIGEHQNSWGLAFDKPQVQLAREINRRILSHAERFVFSPMKAPWIPTVAHKSDPYLSRILWQK